jgi:hypothetical protein
MAEAINEGSTDLIGLARPLTAEPHLIADLLSGVTKAAKPNLVNPNIQTAASYLQIGQIVDGSPIADLSDEETARKVEEAIQRSGPQAMLFRPKF